MRLFFHISYKGTHFNGWQRQPGGKGIQAVIEDALSSILKQKMVIIGCGRTDTGVHASQYFFHISWRHAWKQEWVYYLNCQLPDDITIHEIIPIEEASHAQHSVKERTYNFLLHFKKDAYLKDYSTYYYMPKLDVKLMAEACKLLNGDHKFGSFCLSPDQYPDTTCKVKSAMLFSRNNHEQIRFEITADRFLQGMIRKLVAKLLAVGEGKLSLEAFHDQLKNPRNTTDVKLAYPQGLFLSRISYPFLERPNNSSLAGLLFSKDIWQKL